MNEFKLSPSDENLLIKWGYKPEDFKQIVDFTNHHMTFMGSSGKYMDWQTAKRQVGTEGFLSGISRCAFHYSAYRRNPKQTRIVLFELDL